MFERSSHWRPPVILIAAGAFKHSLTAAAACGAIARGLRASPLTPMLLEFPIADGGNGTLDAFLRHGGERITINVRGPLGAPVDAAFGILPDGETGIIEMALASGLELVRELDAGRASTYGTGQIVRAALDQNTKRLIIGLGGSATTDGGAGCLQALGLSLRDASGAEIPSGGSGLEQLASIDASRLDSRLHNTEIIIAADVDNPAVGPKGAAAVFGPQKGASPADIQQLDRALSHWFNLTYRTTGIDVVAKAGGGAAGALAAGLMAYVNARVQSGVDLLLDYTNFDSHLSNTDLVITGEGKLDSQSLSGKGPIGVARRAQAHDIPVIALVGMVDTDDKALRKAGISAAWPIVDRVMTLDAALKDGEALLERAAYRLGSTFAIQR